MLNRLYIYALIYIYVTSYEKLYKFLFWISRLLIIKIVKVSRIVNIKFFEF